MNTAEHITRLESEVRTLEKALRMAVRGTEADRQEAESILIQRDLQRRPTITPSAFFDVAADICHAPFTQRHFQ